MGSVNYKMKVVCNISAEVRATSSIVGTIVSYIGNGTIVTADAQENGWYHHDKGGWTNSKFLVLISDLSASTVHNASSSVGGGSLDSGYFEANVTGSLNINGDAENPYAATAAYEEGLLNSLDSNGISYKSDQIDSIKYLFGAPEQFTAITDPRPEGSLLGRAYMSTMLSDMSMFVLTPGKASFMSKFSNDFSTKALNKLLGTANDDEKSGLSDILNGNKVGRYYSFESDYTEYMKYVNNLCRISSQLLGIGNHKLSNDSPEYWKMDWSINNFTNSSGILTFLKQEPSVAFYIDGKNSAFSDGMSNSTDQSQFASYMSNASSMSREMMFLFGKGYSDESLLTTSKVDFDNAVKKVVDKLTKNSTLMSTLSDRVDDHAVTLINGGNIAFPEIWKDSSYSKSYSIEFKLVSPYGDVDSFFFHILVPLWHLIPLVYPRQMGANGYINPFLVRGFCKGWFNCSLGICDSISIKRASQEGWSTNGFPTEVDVSLSIKDLYENLALSRAGDVSTLHNTEYLDMIGTWCGVNMNKPELTRKLQLLQTVVVNKLTDFPKTFTAQLQQDINSKLRSYLI